MATAHVQHSILMYSSLKERMFAEETDIGGGGRKGRRQWWRFPSTTSLIQLSRGPPRVTPRGQTLSTVGQQYGMYVEYTYTTYMYMYMWPVTCNIRWPQVMIS